MVLLPFPDWMTSFLNSGNAFLCSLVPLEQAELFVPIVGMITKEFSKWVSEHLRESTCEYSFARAVVMEKWVVARCKVNQQLFVCRNVHKSILDVMTQLSTTLSSKLQISFKKGKVK